MGGSYSDQAPRSPWIAQMAPDASPRPLSADATTDVVVVGAGIAGIATAFFLLRSTTLRVELLESDRVGRGATGRNAGQLTTYFERPLCDIADEFGVERAADAQRGFDDAHDLLDLMVAESGATVPVERFPGHLGMFNVHHVLVHLRCNRVRQRAGLRLESCVVSQDAAFLAEIPDGLADLYTVVSQQEVNELLEIADDRYRAVLSDRKGSANSGLLVQQVLADLERRYPDRFRFHDHTHVDRVAVAADEAAVHAGDRTVRAAYVVLCTNGYVGHEVQTIGGAVLALAPEQAITGRVAYMTAFAESHRRPPAAISYMRNAVIGGDTAYAYLTRRAYSGSSGEVTLTCMGGPEYPYRADDYDPHAPFPGELMAEMDAEVRPFADATRPAGLRYDFAWHGLMGYNDGGIRVVGAHPGSPRLLYNLGCNGVGFLPSIHGGHRIARLLAGERLPPSIFDPR